MDITICIKGKKFDKDSSDATAEYCKRMSAFCKVHVKFFKNYKDFIIPSNAHSIGFVITCGKNSPSSPELATQMNSLQTQGYSSLFFYIPGKTINNEEFPFATFDTLSLSCFQMSGETTTIVLTEQLYRAFTILNHITYHK